MNFLRNLSRMLIAPVFIFSGFVKSIDPLGSTYKFTDYFEAFGMEWLTSVAFISAILLSAAELLIGLNLLFKIRMRFTAWMLLIFMIYFTILTFIIALTNPVTDCGCFGDALIITNWQTFYKNLILLLPTIFIFLQRNKYIQVFKSGQEWSTSIALFLIGIILSIYSYRNLPMIDFRPYKIGTDISASMKIPEGMPRDEYETVLVYEKDGQQKEFAVTDAPWKDSTWVWKETRNTLLKKGFVPPIHDFSLTSIYGEDVTDQLLSNTGSSLLIVAYDLNKANQNGLQQLDSLASQALERGYAVYGMTSSTSNEIESYKTKNNPSFNWHTTDEITLKTMIRSNPGLILVQNGHIIGNWHYRNIPKADFFEKSTLSRAFSVLEIRNNHLIIEVGLLVLLAIGLFIRLTGTDAETN